MYRWWPLPAINMDIWSLISCSVINRTYCLCHKRTPIKLYDIWSRTSARSLACSSCHIIPVHELASEQGMPETKTHSAVVDDQVNLRRPLLNLHELYMMIGNKYRVLKAYSWTVYLSVKLRQAVVIVTSRFHCSIILVGTTIRNEQRSWCLWSSIAIKATT